LQKTQQPNKLEEVKEMARTDDGLTSIILHFLGYKLHEQSELTLPQKTYLREAYFYYQEVMSKAKSRSPKEQRKDKVAGDVKREVKQRYG